MVGHGGMGGPSESSAGVDLVPTWISKQHRRGRLPGSFAELADGPYQSNRIACRKSLDRRPTSPSFFLTWIPIFRLSCLFLDAAGEAIRRRRRNKLLGRRAEAAGTSEGAPRRADAAPDVMSIGTTIQSAFMAFIFFFFICARPVPFRLSLLPSPLVVSSPSSSIVLLPPPA